MAVTSSSVGVFSDARRAAGAGRLREVRDLPGPKGLPLLGNVLQIQLSKVHLVLERWAREHGPTFVFWMGRDPIAVFADPKVCDRILRDRPDGFTRSTKLRRIFAELGADGVFAAEGAAWRQQRKLAVHALAQRHLRTQYDALALVAGRLKARWDRLAATGETIEITEEFKRFTVDSTTLIAFGYDINTIEQQGDVIQRKLELIFPMLSRRLFALVPWWRFVRLPIDHRTDRALADLADWLKPLVADARARLAADPARAETPANFLEAMVAARDDDGNPFTEEVLFANLLTMLVAGEDTTAYTLAWAVHELCDSPASVAALRQEADAIVGASPYPADIDVANRLEVAGAVASETMRLRPVAPFMFLNALEETVVEDVRIPAAAKLAVLSRPAALDAAHFADPAAFNPRRWIEETTPHDMRVSIPFGSGPRICPGRALAQLEMKLVLAMLYRNFEVERVGPASDVVEDFSFTMMAKGLKVRLRPRAPAASL